MAINCYRAWSFGTFSSGFASPYRSRAGSFGSLFSGYGRGYGAYLRGTLIGQPVKKSFPPAQQQTPPAPKNVFVLSADDVASGKTVEELIRSKYGGDNLEPDNPYLQLLDKMDDKLKNTVVDDNTLIISEDGKLIKEFSDSATDEMLDPIGDSPIDGFDVIEDLNLDGGPLVKEGSGGKVRVDGKEYNVLGSIVDYDQEYTFKSPTSTPVGKNWLHMDDLFRVFESAPGSSMGDNKIDMTDINAIAALDGDASSVSALDFQIALHNVNNQRTHGWQSPMTDVVLDTDIDLDLKELTMTNEDFLNTLDVDGNGTVDNLDFLSSSKDGWSNWYLNDEFSTTWLKRFKFVG